VIGFKEATFDTRLAWQCVFFIDMELHEIGVVIVIGASSKIALRHISEKVCCNLTLFNGYKRIWFFCKFLLVLFYFVFGKTKLMG